MVNPRENALNFIIYYKSLKTKNLLMSNDMSKKREKMLCTWTIYKYTCPRGDYKFPNPQYIGQTRNTYVNAYNSTVMMEPSKSITPRPIK